MSNTNSNDTNDYHHEEVVKKEEEARGLGDGSDFGEIQSDDSNLKYNKGSLSENKKEETETSTDNFFSQTKKEEEIIIPLISEELGVTKTELVDEAIITKEPFKETKTEELAIMHEELVIERRPVIDNLSSVDHNDNNYKTLSGYENEKVNLEKTNTIIKIPLKREEIEVTKKPYIIEELLVKKKPVTKTQTLTEEIITERVIDPQV
jgi:uncharacterized protein (TIGR02271 family)